MTRTTITTLALLALLLGACASAGGAPAVGEAVEQPAAPSEASAA
jgi:hypothetical protein